MSKYLPIDYVDSIEKIPRNDWIELNHESPFTSYEFLLALEKSGSTSVARGWKPVITILKNTQHKLCAALIGHIKNHSYGEYIFDWNIAQAYQEMGETYYPKFCSSIPFTPVNTRKIIYNPNELTTFHPQDLVYRSEAQDNVHSYHHLFISQDSLKDFSASGYIPRLSLQYHWMNNDYSSFQCFLQHCTSTKRKMIKKERETVSQSELSLKSIEPDQMKNFSLEVYELYLETIRKKGSIAYLNLTFFEIILDTMKHVLVLDLAFNGDKVVAFSLFFKSSNALYGRYWGVRNDSEPLYPFLHFEMCYYRGIDLCIKTNLPLFEAGAQGDHKISRGFRPIPIYSAHKFKNPHWHLQVERYMKSETSEMMKIIDLQSQRLPFRLGS